MPSWTMMNNLAAGDLVTEADMDAIRGNIEYLLVPNSFRNIASTGTYTTTSTSWTVVNAGFSNSITTYGGPLLVYARGVFSVSANSVMIGISVDGTVYPDPTLGGIRTYNTNADYRGLVTITDLISLAAGAHTVALVWKQVTSGTATITMTEMPLVFFGLEL